MKLKKKSKFHVVSHNSRQSTVPQENLDHMTCSRVRNLHETVRFCLPISSTKARAFTSRNKRISIPQKAPYRGEENFTRRNVHETTRNKYGAENGIPVSASSTSFHSSSLYLCVTGANGCESRLPPEFTLLRVAGKIARKKEWKWPFIKSCNDSKNAIYIKSTRLRKVGNFRGQKKMHFKSSSQIECEPEVNCFFLQKY